MRTFKIVTRVITAFIGAVALFVLISLLPLKGNYTFRIVESGSMEPAIRTGSVIATIPRAEYAVGDIVTFAGTSANATPTTHRIVGIESEAGETLFITKGDANEEEDYRRVGEGEILGKVFLSVPYAGYGVRALDTANGKAVLVTAIILLVALSLVPRGTFKPKQKEGNEA